MPPDHLPTDPPPEVLAHRTRNCLAVAHGRVQILRRAVRQGDVDPARLIAHLDEVDGCLRRLAGLIDALEARARPARRPEAAADKDY